MKPVELYMEEGRVICSFTLHIDVRAGEQERSTELVLSGLRRMEGIYDTADGPVEIAVKTELTDRFSFGAVNVRVEDKTPVIRKWCSPKMNVSRAYIYARYRGLMKLTRFVWRKPDVFINLSGKDMENPWNRAVVASVVQHEFGHVLGFRDKYKCRKRKFIKRNPNVSDSDIMYRVGDAQGFMEYHINRLKECASRGKLPFRGV